MGNSQSVFSEDQLEEYENCTFFTKKEILGIHQRFQQLNVDNKEKLSREQVLALPELSVNPFREQIVKVFSEDGSGAMTFEDFLDFLSVFSEGATRDVKASYAFRIYDIDGDGYLDKSDLLIVISSLVGSELNENDMEYVCDRILEESDLDGDQRLSYVEFEHIIARAPDFINTFRIRI
eukprot:Opistho-1_new@18863